MQPQSLHIPVGVQCGAAAYSCVELRPNLVAVLCEVAAYPCDSTVWSCDLPLVAILCEAAAYFSGSTVWSYGLSFVAVL